MAVQIASTNRMAASALATYLEARLQVPVDYGWPDPSAAVRVAVLLASREWPNTVPRLVLKLRSAARRLILVYDGHALGVLTWIVVDVVTCPTD